MSGLTSNRPTSDELEIRPEVAARLGYYVYLYVDPRDERPFYVGKGQERRALPHLGEAAESRKCAMLDELRAAGLTSRVDVLAHGMRDEETAFRIEAAVVGLFGLDVLTNAVRGWKSLQFGRLPLAELAFHYAAKPVTVVVPSLLVRINRLYRHNMTPHELYEATRGVWRVGSRCAKARIRVRCIRRCHSRVYEIDSWHPAATTPYSTQDAEKLAREGRRELLGRVADPAVRDVYVRGSIADHFRQGLQSPVVYVNC
jgi:hypothetical protein